MVKDEEAKAPEEPLFKTPEFDETEFLQTENRSAKLIYISLSVAVLAGILSFLLMRIVYWAGSDLYRILPIAVPVVLLALVYYLMLKFRIDYRDLDWKKYLENGFMYVVTWGAIWIVSMNPPFSDLASPSISDPVVKVTAGSVSSLEFEENVTYHNVRAFSAFFVITDNVGVDGNVFKVHIQDQGSSRTEIVVDSAIADELGLKVGRVNDNTSLAPDKNDTKSIRKVEGWYGSDIDDWGRNLYEVTFMNLTSKDQAFTVTIEVMSSDRKGNEAGREFSFRVDND
jgi:hypothetical protein